MGRWVMWPPFLPQNIKKTSTYARHDRMFLHHHTEQVSKRINPLTSLRMSALTPATGAVCKTTPSDRFLFPFNKLPCYQKTKILLPEYICLCFSTSKFTSYIWHARRDQKSFSFSISCRAVLPNTRQPIYVPSVLVQRLLLYKNRNL